MRMRRKKNLEKRLQNCESIWVQPKENDIISWKDIFENDHPIQLEIGCGKGQFIKELALREPDINFVALEIQSNVIVMAMENIMNAGVSNVRFLCLNADRVAELFAPKSVDRIYLNFSCPFPKKRYAKHRLTYRGFLYKYAKILKPYGEIHFKTDNRPFFDFSMQEFIYEKYKVQNVTFDLHNSNMKDNIVTEYEKRFSDMGQPIYRLEAVCIPHQSGTIEVVPRSKQLDVVNQDQLK